MTPIRSGRRNKPAVRPRGEAEALFLANLALAKAAMKKCLQMSCPVQRIDPDEALQLALLGLWRAAELWEPARGAFSTCAYLWVKHHLFYEARRRAVEAKRSPVKMRPGTLDGLSGARTPEENHQWDGLHREIRLEAALRYLDPLGRRVLLRRVAEGWTYAEIGRAERVTAQRARQLEQRALAKIKAVLGVRR